MTILFRAFLSLIFCLTAASFAADVLPDSQKLDIFLLVGQSNMAGRGKIEDVDKTPDPHVWVFNQQKTWAPAVDPLHFDKPKIAGVGLGLNFGKTLVAKDPSRFIGLVPAAVGGTSIDQWKKGGQLYEDALARAKAALKHGTLAGILWHQGEADSSQAKTDAYPEKFEKLVQNFRAELQAPDVPVIAGQLGEFHAKKAPGTTHFNEMLMDLHKKVPHMAAVSSKDFTSIGDDTHFDAKSQREFGKRYAEAYLQLSGAKK